MDFDIIITTNNRADSINTLVHQILEHKTRPQNIIVVDSSEYENKTLLNNIDIIYQRSSHANQPYQRYLGYLIATSQVILYLDDDMEIVHSNALAKIVKRFDDNDVVGLAINFVNENEFFNSKLPKSKLAQKNNNNSLMKFIRRISGLPQLKPGQYSYCGIKGPQPNKGGTTQWVSGGAFAVKRNKLYNNFNFKLFDIYEKKLGKGEDGILGFTLAQNGSVVFENEVLFIHNDKQDSTYTKNLYSFSNRVAYSRAYLSFEYARLLNTKSIKTNFIYHWYMFGRIMGLILNQLIEPRKERTEVIKGTLNGWGLAIRDSQELQSTKQHIDWKGDAENDSKQ